MFGSGQVPHPSDILLCRRTQMPGCPALGATRCWRYPKAGHPRCQPPFDQASVGESTLDLCEPLGLGGAIPLSPFSLRRRRALLVDAKPTEHPKTSGEDAEPRALRMTILGRTDGRLPATYRPPASCLPASHPLATRLPPTRHRADFLQMGASYLLATCMQRCKLEGMHEPRHVEHLPLPYAAANWEACDRPLEIGSRARFFVIRNGHFEHDRPKEAK